jgi:hypothetical protein
MILRLSNKVAKRMKISERPELPMSVEPFADWSVHQFVSERKPMLILMHTPTLVAFVHPARGVTTLAALASTIEAAAMRFVEEMFPTQKMARELFGGPELIAAKAYNRATIGSMNDLIYMACVGFANGDTVDHVNRHLARVPLSLIGMNYPQNLFQKLLAHANR